MGFVVVLQPENNNEIETGMKQRILHNTRHLIIVGSVVMAAAFTGCSHNKHPFVFHTPQEAVVACHEELAKVKQMNSATIDELAQVINTWAELQDSTMSLMMRDSTMSAHNDLASEFFAVADSFRMEITDLALTQKRSMGDVMKLKVATSKLVLDSLKNTANQMSLLILLNLTMVMLRLNTSSLISCKLPTL